MVNMALPRVAETTLSEPHMAILETTRNSDGDIQDDSIDASSGSDSDDEDYTPRLTMADFPKPTRQHIMNCSYSAWHAKYVIPHKNTPHHNPPPIPHQIYFSTTLKIIANTKSATPDIVP